MIIFISILAKNPSVKIIHGAFAPRFERCRRRRSYVKQHRTLRYVHTYEIMGERETFFVGKNRRTQELGAVGEPDVANTKNTGVYVDLDLAWFVNDYFVVDRSPLVQLDVSGVHLTRRHAVKLRIVLLVSHHIHCKPQRTTGHL